MYVCMYTMGGNGSVISKHGFSGLLLDNFIESIILSISFIVFSSEKIT